MIFYILGLAAGFILPLQTSANTKLSKKSGSSVFASLFTFTEALIILTLFILISEKGLHINFNLLTTEPWWIWTGGAWGVIFVAVSALLCAKIGVVQTTILPVLGQILMSLLIDSFGWFKSNIIPISSFKIIGAILAFIGIVVSNVKFQRKTNFITKNEKKSFSPIKIIYILLGIMIGMTGAIQTAVNAQVGLVLGSTSKATLISFAGGILFALLLGIFILIKNKGIPFNKSEKNTWWMYTGGILGLIYVYASIALATKAGTAVTVVMMLLGSTAGGLIIDTLGLFETQKQKLSVQKILGLLILIAGVSFIQFIK